MKRCLVISAVAAAILRLFPAGAQTVAPAVPLDGPALSADADSLDLHVSGGIAPMPALGMHMSFDMFSKMIAPMYETRQSRAFKVSNRIREALTPSIMRNNAAYFQPMPKYWYPMMMVAGLFLTPQFAIPYGYYPMMSPSNPFAIASVPGWAPEQPNKYSPEFIPQCIELEYDFATGQYRQKMVDWKVYEQRAGSINPSRMNTAPVPRIPINDVERRIMTGLL